MKRIFLRLAVVVFCWVLPAMVQGAEPDPAEGNGQDVLVYKDGDRIHGRLVEQTANIIVFESERFGTLRVPVANAVIIKAGKAPETTAAVAVKGAPPATAAGNLRAAAERAEVEKMSVWDWFSPAVLTAKLANYFGPWHGKIAFSTEVVSDTSDRNNVALETQLQRKWKSDEVQLKARYDYSKTNELTTTDLIKADGLWRHDFPKSRFALYRPTLEWNRANFIINPAGVSIPSDYVLLQQEIGVGLSLVSTASRKVRIGVSENLFDSWTLSPPGESHSSRTVESAFVETELKLPWRMSLTERAVYYYSIASATDGWENTFELSKKFTETLSTSIRHEVRRNNPDGRAPDYTRLKLLFGLDF
jgi:hypothetical protein